MIQREIGDAHIFILTPAILLSQHQCCFITIYPYKGTSHIEALFVNRYWELHYATLSRIGSSCAPTSSFCTTSMDMDVFLVTNGKHFSQDMTMTFYAYWMHQLLLLLLLLCFLSLFFKLVFRRSKRTAPSSTMIWKRWLQTRRVLVACEHGGGFKDNPPMRI